MLLFFLFNILNDFPPNKFELICKFNEIYRNLKLCLIEIKYLEFICDSFCYYFNLPFFIPKFVVDEVFDVMGRVFIKLFLEYVTIALWLFLYY
jgi:hypothetical protein